MAGYAAVLVFGLTIGQGQTLVGYYNFNQSSSPIVDQAGTPVNMAQNGSPSYNQSAIPGQSFGATASLNGSSYWFASGATEYSNLTNDLTVMAWINPASIIGASNGHSTVIFGTTTGGGGWGFGFFGTEQGAGAEGRPYFVNYGIASYDLGPGFAQIAAGSWVNLAITKSSTAGVSIFINGSLIGTISSGTAGASAPASNDWYIGNGADLSRNFVGGIDELRIYNGVLSQSQIQSISAIPEPSTYAALVGVAVLGLAGWSRRRARAGAVAAW